MGENELSTENTGVIVVDVQADFTELKSGTLAVPGTDARYIETVQTATRQFFEQGLPIYFTQDWHPVDHVSFFTNNPGTEPFQEIEIEKGQTQVRRVYDVRKGLLEKYVTWQEIEPFVKEMGADLSSAPQ